MSAIELTSVSRWYGNVVAVNDVTMTIGPGVTGLLGPNGAGKSTILHMIAGFLAPSKGTLTIGGKPSWENPEIYRRLGLVPERDSVYALVLVVLLAACLTGLFARYRKAARLS